MIRSRTAVAEVTQARHDELVRVEALVDDRRVDVDVGMMLFDERDAFGRGDDADHPHVVAAGAAYEIERGDGAPAGRQHRIDHQDERAAQVPRQLRIVPATRLPSSRRAAGRCGRPAPWESAPARHRACRAPLSAPARPPRRPDPLSSAGPSGVCTRHAVARNVPRRFSRQQQADAHRHVAEVSGGVEASRRVARASWTSGC